MIGELTNEIIHFTVYLNQEESDLKALNKIFNEVSNPKSSQ